MKIGLDYLGLPLIAINSFAVPDTKIARGMISIALVTTTDTRTITVIEIVFAISGKIITVTIKAIGTIAVSETKRIRSIEITVTIRIIRIVTKIVTESATKTKYILRKLIITPALILII